MAEEPLQSPGRGGGKQEVVQQFALDPPQTVGKKKTGSSPSSKTYISFLQHSTLSIYVYIYMYM